MVSSVHKSVENVSMVISVITRTEVALVVVTKASMVINVTKVCHIAIYIDNILLRHFRLIRKSGILFQDKAFFRIVNIIPLEKIY